MRTATRHGLAALTLGLLVTGPSMGESQQHQDHQMMPPPDPAAVAACAQAQLPLSMTIDTAEARLERARQANEAAAMRAAIADLQRVLLDIRSLLKPCATLQVADPHAGHR